MHCSRCICYWNQASGKKITVSKNIHAFSFNTSSPTTLISQTKIMQQQKTLQQPWLSSLPGADFGIDFWPFRYFFV